MRAALLTPLLCFGLALAGFAFALKERAARHALEREIDEQRTQRDQAKGEAHRAGARRADAATAPQPRPADATAADVRDENGAPAPTAVATDFPVRPTADRRAALRDDPRVQNLQLAAADAKFRTSYRPLWDALQLAEPRQQEFLAILRRRAEQEMDLAAIVEKKQAPEDDPIFLQLKQQLAAETRAALAPVLGEAGLKQFETYERSVPAREFVNGFAGATAVAGLGITAAQAEALTVTLANASATYRDGGAATVPSIDWEKALGDAAAILPEPQLAFFKNATLPQRNLLRLQQLSGKK